MAEPFLAEIRMVSFSFAPKGWALCNGQLLPINQNQALFSLLGTTFGGDGRVNFALPDLRARVPVHTGQDVLLGQAGGEQAHTITAAEMPAHSHAVKAGISAGAAATDPTGNFWGMHPQVAQYRTDTNNVAMNAAAISTVAGGSQAHLNMQPFLVVNFIIALVGIFPSRS